MNESPLTRKEDKGDMEPLLVLPKQVQKTMAILEESGHEVYLVGGAVRDSLIRAAQRRAALGQGVSEEQLAEQEAPEEGPGFDYDLATDATPEEVRAVFDAFNKTREERALPPVQVLETGIAHGTLTLLIPGPNPLPVEITTYRKDGKYGDNRHPDEVTYTASLEEDLARRDFTVNAMAYHPERGLVDPYGGQEDLAHGRLCCVGEELGGAGSDRKALTTAEREAIARRRLSEDALRILRALRFAATHGFAVEEGTAKALRAEKGRLENISPERVREELTKLIHGTNCAAVLIEYAEVIAVVIPEMKACIGFDQHTKYHCYDVWAHCAHAAQNARLSMASAVALQEQAASQEGWMASVRHAIFCLKWAALLHDIEKPSCFFRDEEGNSHFYGHAEKSAEVVDAILGRLRFDNASREKILFLIANHDRQFVLDVKPIKRAIRKFGKEDLLLLMDLYSADCSAQSELARDRLKAHDMMRQAVMHLTKEEDAVFARKDLAVDGNDLTAMGYEGAAIGEALERLLDAVVDEQVPNDREALLAYLKDS